MSRFSRTIVTLAIVTAACGGSTSSEELAPMAESMAMESSMRVAPAPQAAPAPAPQSPVQPAADRMVIRTVDLELSVADPTESADAAVAIIEGHGGHLDGSTAWRDGNRMHHELQLRVPVASLDAAVAELKSIAGRVEREQVSSTDVTEQTIDMEARLRNLRLTEEELVALLTESRQRNQDVQGIMAIYRELTQMRGQIDSLDGRLKSLSGRAALSTIQLSLRPDAAGAAISDQPWRPSVVIRNSLRMLVRVMQGLISLALFAAIVLLPTVLVLYAVVGAPWKAWRRRRMQAKAEQ